MRCLRLPVLRFLKILYNGENTFQQTQWVYTAKWQLHCFQSFCGITSSSENCFKKHFSYILFALKYGFCQHLKWWHPSQFWNTEFLLKFNCTVLTAVTWGKGTPIWGVVKKYLNSVLWLFCFFNFGFPNHMQVICRYLLFRITRTTFLYNWALITNSCVKSAQPMKGTIVRGK